MDSPPGESPRAPSTDLVMVPVPRQVGVPLAIVGLILLAGVVAAVIDPPRMHPWWRIVVGVALVVVPAAATMAALQPARRMWKSAAVAPMWAVEEAAGATVWRFKWTILVAVIVVALGAFSHTLPALGLVALGIAAALAQHLARALRWQSANGRALFNEAALAASPQGARAYWTPRP